MFKYLKVDTDVMLASSCHVHCHVHRQQRCSWRYAEFDLLGLFITIDCHQINMDRSIDMDRSIEQIWENLRAAIEKIYHRPETINKACLFGLYRYVIIIIIITNEKIKVMLSRKRCRGTLQDYNNGEISRPKCQ